MTQKQTIYDLVRLCEAAHIDVNSFRVFIHLLEHMNPASKLIRRSYNEIVKETGINYSTVCDTMQKLQVAGVIRMIAPGCWKMQDAEMFREDEVVPGWDDKDMIFIKNYES